MNRCPYCGYKCVGPTCRACRNLPKIERTMHEAEVLRDLHLSYLIDVLAALPREAVQTREGKAI